MTQKSKLLKAMPRPSFPERFRIPFGFAMALLAMSFNFLALSGRAFAQEAPIRETLAETPAVSQEAFSPITENGLIRAFTEFPVYSFYLGAPDINGVAYVPNFSPRLGLHASWKEFGLATSVALPLPKEEIDRRGNSDQFNLLFSRYWRSFGLDVYYQQYRGFYIASPWSELNIQRPARYPQLPDAEVINSGFNFYSVLQPEKYSMSASFAQTEIQRVHGGSWILTVFYNHLEMKSGHVFIPGSDANMIQSRPELETGSFQTLGAGGGYGHTWVFGRAYFTAQGIAGLGGQLQKIDESVGSNVEGRINFAGKLNANLAAGFAPQNYVFGGKLLADALVSNGRRTQVYSTLLNGQIFFGARF